MNKNESVCKQMNEWMDLKSGSMKMNEDNINQQEHTLPNERPIAPCYTPRLSSPLDMGLIYSERNKQIQSGIVQCL